MYARASVMDPYRAGMRGVSWRSIPRARVSSDSTLPPPPPPPRGSTSDFGMFFWRDVSHVSRDSLLLAPD